MATNYIINLNKLTRDERQPLTRVPRAVLNRLAEHDLLDYIVEHISRTTSQFDELYRKHVSPDNLWEIIVLLIDRVTEQEIINYVITNKKIIQSPKQFILRMPEITSQYNPVVTSIPALSKLQEIQPIEEFASPYQSLVVTGVVGATIGVLGWGFNILGGVLINMLVTSGRYVGNYISGEYARRAAISRDVERRNMLNIGDVVINTEPATIAMLIYALTANCYCENYTLHYPIDLVDFFKTKLKMDKLPILSDNGTLDLSICNALSYYLSRAIVAEIDLVDTFMRKSISVDVCASIFMVAYALNQTDNVLSILIQKYERYITPDIYTSGVIMNSGLLIKLIEFKILPTQTYIYDVVSKYKNIPELNNVFQAYIHAVGATTNGTFISRVYIQAFVYQKKKLCGYIIQHFKDYILTYINEPNRTIDVHAIDKRMLAACKNTYTAKQCVMSGVSALLKTVTSEEIAAVLPFCLLVNNTNKQSADFQYQWVKKCFKHANITHKPIWELAANMKHTVAVEVLKLQITTIDMLTSSNVVISRDEVIVSLLDVLYDSVNIEVWLKLSNDDELKDVFPFASTPANKEIFKSIDIDIVRPMYMVNNLGLFILVKELLDETHLTNIIVWLVEHAESTILYRVLQSINFLNGIDITSITIAFLHQFVAASQYYTPGDIQRMYVVLYRANILSLPDMILRVDPTVRQRLLLLRWYTQTDAAARLGVTKPEFEFSLVSKKFDEFISNPNINNQFNDIAKAAQIDPTQYIYSEDNMYYCIITLANRGVTYNDPNRMMAVGLLTVTQLQYFTLRALDDAITGIEEPTVITTATKLAKFAYKCVINLTSVVTTGAPAVTQNSVDCTIETISSLIIMGFPILPFVFKYFSKYKDIYKQLLSLNNAPTETWKECPTCGGVMFDMECRECMYTVTDVIMPQRASMNISDVDCKTMGINPAIFELVRKNVIVNPRMSFDDIIGQTDAKKLIINSVVTPLQSPQLFPLRSAPTGILLYGPPGTGKTMLAQVASTMAGCKFINVNMSLLTPGAPLKGTDVVQALFKIARFISPCIVFFDEMDTIMSSRTVASEELKPIITEIITQLSGIEKQTVPIIVIGATNYPKSLDKATIRRFGNTIYIALPTQDDKCMHLDRFVKRNNITKYTPYYGEGTCAQHNLVEAVAKQPNGTLMCAECQNSYTNVISFEQFNCIDKAKDEATPYTPFVPNDEYYPEHCIMSGLINFSSADIENTFQRIMRNALGSNAAFWVRTPSSSRYTPYHENDINFPPGEILKGPYDKLSAVDKTQISNFAITLDDLLRFFADPDYQSLPSTTSANISEYADVSHGIWSISEEDSAVQREALVAAKRTANTQQLLRWNRKRNNTIADLPKLTTVNNEFKRNITKTIVDPMLLQHAYMVGNNIAMAQLTTATSVVMESPQLFTDTGIVPPFAVLLYGPPGNGKTEMVKQLAYKSGWVMYSVSPSNIVEKFVGSSAQNVSALFTIARFTRPSIIFLDEIDALLPIRTAGTDGASQNTIQILNEFLVQLDGIGYDNEGLLVIGATNRRDTIDPAALRRFSSSIEITNPDDYSRAEIIYRELNKYKNLDAQLIAVKTQLKNYYTTKNGTAHPIITMCNNLSADALTKCIRRVAGQSLGSNASAWDKNGKPITKDDGTAYAKLDAERKKTIKNFEITLADLNAEITNTKAQVHAANARTNIGSGATMTPVPDVALVASASSTTDVEPPRRKRRL